MAKSCTKPPGAAQTRKPVGKTPGGGGGPRARDVASPRLSSGTSDMGMSFRVTVSRAPWGRFDDTERGKHSAHSGD